MKEHIIQFLILFAGVTVSHMIGYRKGFKEAKDRIKTILKEEKDRIKTILKEEKDDNNGQ